MATMLLSVRSRTPAAALGSNTHRHSLSMSDGFVVGTPLRTDSETAARSEGRRNSSQREQRPRMARRHADSRARAIDILLVHCRYKIDVS